MNIRYYIDLTDAERLELNSLTSGGKHPVRLVKRAQILLAADAGLNDAAIAAAVATGGSTVYRTKRRFVEIGLAAALREQPSPRRPAQAHRQGGGPADSHRLFWPARRPLPLDARTARRRDGPADRA
jgi:hypothetical protein